MLKIYTLAVAAITAFGVALLASGEPDLDANHVLVIREAAPTREPPRRQLILAGDAATDRKQAIADLEPMVRKGDLVVAPVDTLVHPASTAVGDLLRFDGHVRAQGARLVLAYSMDDDTVDQAAGDPSVRSLRHRSTEAGLTFIPKSVERIIEAELLPARNAGIGRTEVAEIVD